MEDAANQTPMTETASKPIWPAADLTPVAFRASPHQAAGHISRRRHASHEVFDGRFDQGAHARYAAMPEDDRASDSRPYTSRPIGYFLKHLADFAN